MRTFACLLTATMAALAAADLEVIRIPDATLVSDDAVIVPPRRNTTLIREMAGDIPTIYYDARTQPVGAGSPALPLPWPRASFRLAYEQQQYIWDRDSVLTAPPGVPISSNRTELEEKRTALSLAYRQSLITPWTWDAQLELSTGVVDRTDPQSDSDLRDLDAVLLFPLVDGRYAGISLGLGASVPIGGDGTDWMRSHQVVGGIASLRAVTQVYDWTTLLVSAEGRLAPGAEQVVWTSPDGREAKADYQGVELSATLSMKVHPLGRVALVQAYEGHWWKSEQVPGQFGTPDERVVTAPTRVVTVLNFPKRTFWSLSVSHDFLTNQDSDADHPWLFGIGAEIVPW